MTKSLPPHGAFALADFQAIHENAYEQLLTLHDFHDPSINCDCEPLITDNQTPPNTHNEKQSCKW